jgi:hypothetical protein
MRKALLSVLIFLISSTWLSAQFVYKIKADSVKITNDSCDAELILENSTKGTKGFLYNYGNGRTHFQKGLIKLSDSTYIIGADTLNLSPGGSVNAWRLNGNAINPLTNFLGTTNEAPFSIRTNNLPRMTFSATMDRHRVGIGTTSPNATLHLYDINPSLFIEGDENSYYPTITMKSVLGTGYISNYGVAAVYGGINLHTNTAYGGINVGASLSGVVSYSLDSSVITHRIIGAPRQTADIFKVSSNPASSGVYEDPKFIIKNTGKIQMTPYPNNVTEDSVLTTDISGNLKMKYFSFQTGTSGTDFNISSSGNTHTFNIPDASLTNRGLITTGVQSFTGVKTFYRGTSSITVNYAQRDTVMNIQTNNNGFDRIFIKNSNGGFSSAAGLLCQNDASNNLQVMMTGTGNGVAANTGVIRAGAVGTNIVITADGGEIRLNAGQSYAGGASRMIIKSAGNVGIGTGSPDASALLDLSSTTQGFLAPRMTASQRTSIASPAVGLLMYDTDSSALFIYNGGWHKLAMSHELGFSGGGGGNYWDLSGNASTSPSTSFLGTTDANRLVFRTKNIENATIDTTGNFGINTSSPQYKLDVNGSARVNTLPFISHRDTILSYDPSTKQLKATNIYARTMLASDVTNNNATANTLADVTGLSFDVTSGVTYKFKFYIVYTAAATTTGSRWAINGPPTTFLHYTSEYSLSTTSTTTNQGISAYNSPSGTNNTSATTTSNIAVIEGVIKASANGTVIARFASEVANSAIIAKGGMGYVEYEVIN